MKLILIFRLRPTIRRDIRSSFETASFIFTRSPCQKQANWNHDFLVSLLDGKNSRSSNGKIVFEDCLIVVYQSNLMWNFLPKHWFNWSVNLECYVTGFCQFQKKPNIHLHTSRETVPGAHEFESSFQNYAGLLQRSH